jgi:hypothetical protein
MSEITQRIQTDASPADKALDLSELTPSSRPAPVVAEPQRQPSQETDLSKISIVATDVQRANTRPEARKDLFKSVKGYDLKPKPRTDRYRIDRSRHGILRNPYFRYRGGPLTRFITLIANLLKFFEQIILGKIRSPRVPPQRQPLPTPPPQQTSLDAQLEREKELKEERERAEKLGLHTHRS